MTYADVFTQILHEVTGKPKKQVFELIDVVKTLHPDKHNFDKELSDQQAEELLNNLRKEKEGILAWLVKGAVETQKNEGHA